tara:strand:- start:402 stop:1346 length:945 start_codon:yes stop_codon:yes gene_type:complete
MNKVRGDTLLTIRSRDLKNTDTAGASGFFTLFESIVLNDNEIMTAKIVSATFPNSWYNLSDTSNNNKLSFKETGDTDYKIITIPNGSYDIDELTSQIKTLIETQSTNNLTYTFTYNEINNTLTIKNSNPSVYNTTFDFTTETSCRRFLGFLESIVSITDTNGIVSNRAVDITDTQNSIYIRTNLSNNKVIESNSGKYSNILAHIPVPLSRNAFFVYDPMSPFEMELSQQSLSNIQIFITYQDEKEIVVFNKGDWEINIVLSYYHKIHNNRKHHTIHKSIMDRYNEFNNNMRIKQKQQLELDELVKNKNVNKKNI